MAKGGGLFKHVFVVPLFFILFSSHHLQALFATACEYIVYRYEYTCEYK